MNDLDLLVAGAMVTFIAVAGAYVSIRHRANESPVESHKDGAARGQAPTVAHPSPEGR
jgi:hypothetical protein